MFGIASIPGPDIFELVLFMAEHMAVLVALNVVLFVMVRRSLRWVTVLALPGLWALMIVGVFMASHEDAARRGYDTQLPSVRTALDTYINTGVGDLADIIESGRYPPTFGVPEMKYLVKDLLSHTLLHLDMHNWGNIAEGYNKGNDWFRATLGEPMVYTSGMYKYGNESLWEAQLHKLDYVAHAIELQEGDEVLDIGCGWGRLVQHFTDKYKAKVTGITLSSKQIEFATKLNEHNDGRVFLQDGMTIHERADLMPKSGKFDKITCLEMAEHVGIRRYNKFLTQTHSLLKDDGVLYFQVAGLRRQWRFEDIVWGLFMGENVFPGADASCPLGWVTTQLERAGFEVQRVSNLGTHYSRTLSQWLEEWHAARQPMIAKYGEVSYRRWEVFLSWSIRIARQGSSTVFMITATKQGQEERRIQTQKHLAPQ